MYFMYDYLVTLNTPKVGLASTTEAVQMPQNFYERLMAVPNDTSQMQCNYRQFRHNRYEPSAILAWFRPSACPSACPFVCPSLLVLARLVSHVPAAAARAVYFGPQLAACRLCLPHACRARPSVHPSHARAHISRQSYFNIQIRPQPSLNWSATWKWPYAYLGRRSCCRQVDSHYDTCSSSCRTCRRTPDYTRRCYTCTRPRLGKDLQPTGNIR